MQVDYLIIGQGVSGTWLSYYLQKEKKSFLVIDNDFPNSPSRIAAGIINPVTGRRHVTVWMAENILPFASKAYTEIGNELSITAISQKNIVDFFPSPQMRLSFQQRVEEDPTYVQFCIEDTQYHDLFRYEFGCGTIQPVYTANLESLLPAWRQHLEKNNQLIKEEFDIAQLEITTEHIQYKHIRASRVIFCDGAAAHQHPYFTLLPFAPNKGEVLLAEIPDLPVTHIYKKGMLLAPLATPGLWWIGSSYAWQFDNEDPTIEFREKTEQLLQHWLKVPFRIISHLAGIRPATLERRPFVGFHPLQPRVGLLNGMGTKGCSLAPYFAKQLVDHMIRQQSLHPEADLNRFTKILSRQPG
ncbi:MAG: FAD-binding oxidoreductase [Chitinophagaceae bacterium]|nr:FAD-binding oxidoreductase [Chitinophagaceae bacterium]